MADRILFITWKAPVRGLEERAVESFNEAIGLYGRMQQEGRIESFDVALLNLTGDLGGYLQLNGTAQQLAAVDEDEEFRRHLVAASLVVDDLRMFHGATNAGRRRADGDVHGGDREGSAERLRRAARGAVSTAPRRGIHGWRMTDPDHRLVARIVTVLSERTPAQSDLLASTLAARWSASDRHEPAAHEWLRRWTPKPAHFVAPACTCAAGRCLVCN